MLLENSADSPRNRAGRPSPRPRLLRQPALLPLAILLAVTPFAFAQRPPQEAPQAASVRAVLTRQTAAWNRGDLAAFMSTYAEDAEFVGAEALHGRDRLLARYRKHYPNPSAMGTLDFHDLEIHLIDSHVATAVGAWHLQRSAANGGDVGGLFSLVLRRRGHSWSIILDHTH